MKKTLLICFAGYLFLSCAEELSQDQEIYIGVWDEQSSPFYPHNIITIKGKGKATVETETSSSESTSFSGRVKITGTVLQIGSEKMRIDVPPELDTIDHSYWMQIDLRWYKRN